MTSRKPKYRFLLKDLEVRRWYENTARGAEVTADVYLRRVGFFCAKHGLTPRGLVGLGEEKVTQLLLDTVSDLERRQHAGSYIESIVKAGRSWLKHNRIQLTVKITITDADDSPTLNDERTPTIDELGRFFRACQLDARVASALVTFSAVRPEVLGNYRGTDGLQIGDLLEIEIDNNTKKVEFKKTPTLISVRKTISKAGHRYYTFHPEEGCRYLKE